MKQTRSIFAPALVFGIVLLTAAVTFGQQKVEPSYEVALQVVVGSDGAGRTDLPSNFTAITKILKNSFAFSNYRLASTFLGRISDTGNFEFKSVSNVLGQPSANGAQTFLEWSLTNFRSMQTEKGQPGFQAQSFRFGARVPVVTGSFKDESGKGNRVINYESIGVALSKVGFSENVPTLMGTLSLPGTTGTAFLVVTIKSADQ